MKYSILGFNQEKVLGLRKNIMVDGKEKNIAIDVTDLLILREIADFMNRKKIIKYTINDKIFSCVKYSIIIEDLPILGIKQQALSDRLWKLCEFGLLEKEVVKNQAGSFTAFRIGDMYENIVYGGIEENGSNETQLHKYSDTSANVVNYECNNNYYYNNPSTKTNNIEKKENIKEKKERNKYPEDFEKAWVLAQRKGSKSEAFKYWQRLKDEDKEKIIAHLPFYYKSNEMQYLKDFSGYINRCYYSNVVYDRQGRILYDPERQSSNIYRPTCDVSLMWNDYYSSFIFVGYWDGVHIPDGYTDETRPNGATIMLNNGRGNITWNSETKTWNKL